MIPEETGIYLQIKNGEALLHDLDPFLEGLNLTPMMQGMPLKDFLTQVLVSAGSPIQLRDIELTRPIGIAIMSENDEDMMIFIPLSEIAEPEVLADNLRFSETSWTALHDGYLIISTQAALLETFPPERTADVAILRDYPENTLQTYINYSTLVESLDMDMQEAANEADLDVEGNAVVAQFLELYSTMLEHFDAMGMAFRFDGTGLGVRADMELSGELAALVRTMKPYAGALEYPVPRLPNTVFASVSAMRSEDSLRWLHAIETRISEDQEATDILAPFFAMSREYLELRTGLSALSVALNPITDKTELLNSDIPVTFDLVMVEETRDRNAYMNMTRGWIEESQVLPMITGFFAEELEVSLEYTVADGVTPAGREYQEFIFTFDGPEDAANMAALFNSYRIYQHAEGDRVYTCIGTRGSEMIDAVLNAPAQPVNHSADIEPYSVWEFDLVAALHAVDPEAATGMPDETEPWTGHMGMHNDGYTSEMSMPMAYLQGMMQFMTAAMNEQQSETGEIKQKM
ncbi:MAG: hypothetical protein ACOC0D_08820 [Spirochaeta sp.]